MTEAQDNRAVDNFREYLRIKSVHPNPDYDGCVKFLTKLANEIGLKSQVVQLDEVRPVVILTLEGQEPDLPSILLNSHMDVVPVYEDEWKYGPFKAHMESNGDIYARGTQDMKNATMAELEAVWRLKERGVKLKRTVHMTIAPDEEIGSEKGMAKFVQREEFEKLKVGFDLDEGLLSDCQKATVFTDERCSWGVLIHCPGTTGHGSLILPETAGEKVRVVIDHFMDFRKREEEKLNDPRISLGEVTSINLTQLMGGIQNNVVPPELTVGFDMRISANGDHDEIENWILDVCKKAGNGVYPEYLFKNEKTKPFCFTTNKFWQAFDSTLKKLDVSYNTANLCGATDARFVRRVGIPAIGFAPFFNTEIRIHAHNEFINKNVFLQAVKHYETIIENLANV